MTPITDAASLTTCPRQGVNKQKHKKGSKASEKQWPVRVSPMNESLQSYGCGVELE